MIDNILYVFEWLKTNQSNLFGGKIDLNRIGLIGHSFGSNSLLFWINRTLDSFYKDSRSALLFREDQKNVKECLILMDPNRFSYGLNNRYPSFFLFAEEREGYQKTTGCYDEMMRAGHKVHYYKGSTHISFMDHGYIESDERYFNGTFEKRAAFFDEVRRDVREFLKQYLYD